MNHKDVMPCGWPRPMGRKAGRREKEQTPKAPSSWDLLGGDALLSGDCFSVAFTELGSWSAQGPACQAAVRWTQSTRHPVWFSNSRAKSSVSRTQCHKESKYTCLLSKMNRKSPKASKAEKKKKRKP